MGWELGDCLWAHQLRSNIYAQVGGGGGGEGGGDSLIPERHDVMQHTSMLKHRHTNGGRSRNRARVTGQGKSQGRGVKASKLW